MKQLLLLLSILLCTTYSSYAGSEKDVKDAMKDYAAALANKDGDAVVNAVSKQSLTFMDDMLTIVKTFDQEQIDQLDFDVKELVNTVRTSIEPIQLREIKDGKQLLKYMVEEEVYNKKLIICAGIKYITVKDNLAMAKLYYSRTVFNVYYYFYLENGEWHFDLPQLMEAKKDFMKKFALFFGISEEKSRDLFYKKD